MSEDPTPTTMDTIQTPYTFPRTLLRPLMNSTKTPLILICSGSFSPLTYGHVHLFSVASSYIVWRTDFELIATYISPTASTPETPNSAPTKDRLAMCTLATTITMPEIMVDDWESRQNASVSKLDVLKHFDHEINTVLGGITQWDLLGKRSMIPARILFLCGADMVENIGIGISPDAKWTKADFSDVLSRFGLMVIERAETVRSEITKGFEGDLSRMWIARPLLPDGIISARVRMAVAMGVSIRGVVPVEVEKYIKDNGLYVVEKKQASQT